MLQDDLRQGTFTDSDGLTRQLGEEDFMVVAPYAAQGTPATSRASNWRAYGTVDKFQDQQAPIVFSQ